MVFRDHAHKLYRILALLVTITLWILLSSSDLSDSIPNFDRLWRVDSSYDISRTPEKTINKIADIGKEKNGKERLETANNNNNNTSISITDLSKVQDLDRATWEYFHILLSHSPEVSMNNPKSLIYRDKLLRLLTYIGDTYPCQSQRYSTITGTRTGPMGDIHDSNGMNYGESLFSVAMTVYPLPFNLNRIVSTEWGCHIHNYVNGVLGKPLFDCGEMVRRIPGGSELAKVTLEKEEKQLG